MSDAPELDPEYLQPGTRIGYYVVETRLGGGTFGTVYLVSRDGLFYALKISKLRLADVPEKERRETEDRFNREVGTLMSLSHPNIVRVHGLERWPDKNGYQYLVMDLIEGKPLHVWVQKSRPSVREVLKAFEKISLALYEMHRLEVFHRDLKNDNVLVRASDREPIIVDFGLARPRSAYTLTRQEVAVGTLSHFAPEYAEFIDSDAFLEGKARFVWKATTDLYAVGVMLFEALTGREPYQAEDEHQLRAAIKRRQAQPPSQVNTLLPGAVDALALKLLEKKPEARHQSGKELAEAIALLLSRAPEGEAGWDTPLGLPPERDPNAPTAGGAKKARDAQAPDAVQPPAGNQAVAHAPTHIKEAAALPGRSAASAMAKAAAPPPSVQEAQPAQAPESHAVWADAFKAPTAVKGFKPPDAGVGPPGAGRETKKDFKDAERKLREAHSRTRKKGALGLLIVGGVLACVAVGVGALVFTTSPKASKPESLLARVQREDGAPAQPTMARQAPQAPDDELRRAAPPEPVPVVVAEPASAPEATSSGSKSGASEKRPGKGGARNEDERAIDADLSRGGRPVIPGPGKSDKKAEPSPFAPVHSLVASADPGAKKTLGIPTGTHIRVRLMSNLDSDTVGFGPMEARLEHAFWLRDELKLPARTKVFGTAHAGLNRFNIDLKRLVLPDGRELKIDGLAYDREDSKPGLKPSRIITPKTPKGEGVGTKVAKGAAEVALNTLGGDTAGQVAQRTGQTIMQGDSSGDSSGPRPQLLLDKDAEFDLFLTEPL